MKGNEKLAEALSYLSGLSIKPDEISKDIIFDHDFCKKVFGIQNTSCFKNDLKDWQKSIKEMSLYTDDELEKFFLNLLEYNKTVNFFKNKNIDFTKDDDNPTAGRNGEMQIYYNPYDYFKPLYEYLESIGFVFTDSFKHHGGEYTINFRSTTIPCSIVVRNNPYHESWWYCKIKSFTSKPIVFDGGVDDSEDLINKTKEAISNYIKREVETGGFKKNRDYKSYMIINNIEKFDTDEYLEYLREENEETT